MNQSLNRQQSPFDFIRRFLEPAPQSALERALGINPDQGTIIGFLRDLGIMDPRPMTPTPAPFGGFQGQGAGQKAGTFVQSMQPPLTAPVQPVTQGPLRPTSVKTTSEPPTFINRPQVQPSPRWWGDKEAEAAGLYETPGGAAPAPQGQPQMVPPPTFDQRFKGLHPSNEVVPMSIGEPMQPTNGSQSEFPVFEEDPRQRQVWQNEGGEVLAGIESDKRGEGLEKSDKLIGWLENRFGDWAHFTKEGTTAAIDHVKPQDTPYPYLNDIGSRINPEAWERFLAEAPKSENIEDRRGEKVDPLIKEMRGEALMQIAKMGQVIPYPGQTRSTSGRPTGAQVFEGAKQMRQSGSNVVPHPSREGYQGRVKARIGDPYERDNIMYQQKPSFTGEMGPSGWPATGVPRSKAMPGQEDLELAKKYDRSYGNPNSGYFQQDGATTNRMRLDDVLKTFHSQRNLDTSGYPAKSSQETADKFQIGWMATQRSPLASLGFDMRRVTTSPPDKDRLTIGGYYNQRDDNMWYDMQNDPSAIVHESLHRGIKLLHAAKLFPKSAKGLDEETIVRALMIRHFDDIETKEWDALQGDARTKNANMLKVIEAGKKLANSPLLDEIEEAAGQLRMRRNPRGPR